MGTVRRGSSLAERRGAQRVFIIDPLDGTAAFIKGDPEFCVSIGLVEFGEPIAGVVYNPVRDEMFAARRGGGATLNGEAITVTDRSAVEGARLIGSAAFYGDHRWPTPWPSLIATKVPAMAYRLALVAAGRHDGVVALGYKHEWDLAAGALIVTEAGGRIGDPFGGAFRFNQAEPRLPGTVAAGPALYPLLIERVQGTPHPSVFERAAATARDET